MDEVGGLRVRDEFVVGTPTNLAETMEHKCNCPLISMMVNTRSRTRLNLENSVPDGRRNSQLRRDHGATF